MCWSLSGFVCPFLVEVVSWSEFCMFVGIIAFVAHVRILSVGHMALQISSLVQGVHPINLHSKLYVFPMPLCIASRQ